jgi:cell division protein FtsL
MIRLGTIFWLTLAAVAAIAVFQFKYRVQALEAELVALDGQILRTQEATHVLEAEWSFLNEPRRLEQLSRRYLPMAPMTPAQISTVDLLPMPSEGLDATPDRETPALPGTAKLPLAGKSPPVKPTTGTKTAKSTAADVTLVDLIVKGGAVAAGGIKP